MELQFLEQNLIALCDPMSVITAESQKQEKADALLLIRKARASIPGGTRRFFHAASAIHASQWDAVNFFAFLVVL